jgi:two-component system chemotaxis response regulator CheY
MSTPHSAMPSRPEILFVVEDAPPLRERIVRCLEAHGFPVDSARDAEEARERLSRMDPDLILVDLVLPRDSGFELCEFVRSQPHLDGALIMVMAERPTPQDRAHAEEAGANGYLVKPFTNDQLLSEVESLLAGFDNARRLRSDPPRARRSVTPPPPSVRTSEIPPSPRSTRRGS